MTPAQESELLGLLDRIATALEAKNESLFQPPAAREFYNQSAESAHEHQGHVQRPKQGARS
jgi:hypothetical protein